MSTTDATELPDDLSGLSVREDGTVVCPRCSDTIKVGRGGLKNFMTQHIPSEKCRSKASKITTSKATTRITGFFKPLTKKKADYVPARTKTPPPINPTNSISLGRLHTPPQELDPTHSPTSNRTTSTQDHRATDSSLQALSPSKRWALRLLVEAQTELASLSCEIPTAGPEDELFSFSRRDFLAEYPPDEVWENLDRELNRLVGYGKPVEEVVRLLRRGPDGIAGLLTVVERVVLGCEEVGGELLEGKINMIIRAMRLASGHAPNCGPIQPAAHIVGENATPALPTPYHPPKPHKQVLLVNQPSLVPCDGLELTVSDGKPVLPRYPFLLHPKFLLPWDVEVRRGAVFVRGHGCTRRAEPHLSCCSDCSGLVRNAHLKRILDRMMHGVAENTPFEYQGLAGMMEIAHRKDDQNASLRLRRLNEMRRVVRLEGAVSAQKELIVAIAGAKVPRIGTVLQGCFRRGMGVHAILELVRKAAAGVYHPKSYDEEDESRGLLMLRLGGTKLAEVAHRIFGTPSTSTLRHGVSSPLLIVSPSMPLQSEMENNLDQVFSLIQAELARLEETVHAIAMYDEVAVEKRPRWDPRTNKFVGTCREHGEGHNQEFSSEEDVKLLFEEIDRGKIHLATEATVGAVGLLTPESSLYSARPFLISGSCKRETAERHQVLLQTALNALNTRRSVTRARIVSLASDGESRRGSALINMTFRKQLAPSSPIYNQISCLPLMDLWVGDDDLTPDKDYKHVAFKRVRNALLREKGVYVLGVFLTPALQRVHLQDAGHSAIHVNYLLNASDKQDVMVAFQLLWAIRNLPPAAPSSSPAYLEARNALRLFGTLCYHLIFPYVCVDLSLCEQYQHLSSAAHLVLSLFVHNGAKGRFLPVQLVIDILLMIKNAFYCLAKAKQDRPRSRFYLIQLGTDRLETLFGILRTMVGNDANLDVYQLALRCGATTEVANIFARRPEWQPTSRRLKLPVLTKDSAGKQPVADADHVTPRSWKGDVRVSEVTLRTPWIDTPCG